MSEVLNVEARETRGKRNSRRLRRSGRVPAILYGHDEESVSLSIGAEQFGAAIRHGARVVDLEGSVNESALIRDVQWDTFGVDVLHVDFTRVRAGDTVETSIPVRLRGEAPGTHEGGIVQQPIHEVRLECPVALVPEKLEVNINSLKLGDAITVADLTLPEGAKVIGNIEAVVVGCVAPTIELDEEEGEEGAATAEPEVIGRKAEEEEGD